MKFIYLNKNIHTSIETCKLLNLENLNNKIIKSQLNIVIDLLSKKINNNKKAQAISHKLVI